MKIRSILYGYCISNGKITIHQGESKIITEICNMYLDGQSMMQIAKTLTERKVEYMPGAVAWNKAKIMRMLEDKRYLGDDTYPLIIDRETYEKIQKIKYDRNDQKGVDKEADIFQLNVPIRCPKCNTPMYRRVDKRLVTTTKWVCKNKNCMCSVAITDEQLLSAITEMINGLIANPHLINIPIENAGEPSIELIRLNNEISRLFDSPQIDRESAKVKLLEYFSVKYQETDAAIGIAKQLKDIFAGAIPLQAFCPHLFDKAVDEIRLYTDGTVGIVLANKQEIRKGGQYGTR